jgi:death-on-curing protein
MRLLSLEHILQIHILLIKETGGSNGVRDLGRLESVIASQSQFVFGEELYSGFYEKSAAIIKGIIADHPFVDGNKRTAMLAGLTFLGANNIHFLGKKGSIENYAVKIAVEHLTIKEIASWLKQNCRLAI